MPQPIAFTEQENRNLQETFLEIAQDAQRRQYYELVLPSILSKLEAQPATVTFTEQESRAIQQLYQGFDEQIRPFPVLQSRVLTFGQDLRQLTVVDSILKKLEAAS